MPQQTGRLLVIAREITAGSGTYATIGAVKSRNFKLSNERVDTTVPDEDDPGDPLVKTAVAGIQDQSFDAAGKFIDSARMIGVAEDARLGRAWNYKVTVPGYGSFVAPWTVSEFTFTGAEQGTMDFSANWAPVVAPFFTAAAP